MFCPITCPPTFVSSCNNLSYLERLRKLGLPTWEYRRERADAIQTYEILHGVDSVNRDKLFIMVQYRATSGHSYKLHKNIKTKSFSNRVVNNMPKDVVNATSVNVFKRRLNKNKFLATCYQPDQRLRGICTQYQQASLQVR